MKRVLHLFPAYKIGGAPVNVLRFIRGSKGHIMNFSAGLRVDEEMFTEYSKSTEQNYDIDLTRLSLKTYIRLLRIVFKIRPDIIHANGKGGGIYAFLLYPFFKGKIFYTFRGFHIKFSGIKQKAYIIFERLFSLIYTKAIAVSHSEKEIFLTATQVKEEKVLVIGNGVETNKRPLPDNIELQVNKHMYNLVTLSRVAEIKDLETMIKAFELLENDTVALHIIGGHLPVDEGYKQKIEDKISSSNCKDQIYLWGDIWGAGDYLHNFDLYLSTSLSEGLPTAIVEAGLSEIPVLCSDCNGNIDLIEEGYTGYLFPKKDYISLADKMRSAINQLGTTDQQKIIANNLVQMKDYSIEQHVSKILNLYFWKD